MASHRPFDESQLISQGLLLLLLVTLTAGCRSAGGNSRMPGMGWLAGSQRSGERDATEIDPTASLPAPSSVTTPQTLADAERPQASPTHQPVSYDAPRSSQSTVAAANYPSTGYPQIPAVARPEPNPVVAKAAPRASAPAADYVQEGPYSAGAPPADAATTWNSPLPDAIAAAAGTPASTSIYRNPATPPITETPAASLNTSAESVYGMAASDPPPSPGGTSTTWNTSPATSVHPPADPHGLVPSPPEQAYETREQQTVSPASYRSLADADGSLYQNPGEPTAIRTATGPGEPWRPGSTSSYQVR